MIYFNLVDLSTMTVIHRSNSRDVVEKFQLSNGLTDSKYQIFKEII